MDESPPCCSPPSKRLRDSTYSTGAETLSKDSPRRRRCTSLRSAFQPSGSFVATTSKKPVKSAQSYDSNSCLISVTHSHLKESILVLPRVVQNRILSFCDVKSLSFFCITSKTAQKLVFEFVKSRCFTKEKKHCLEQKLGQFSNCEDSCVAPKQLMREEFHNIGLLVKRLTMHLPTSERIALVGFLYDRIGQKDVFTLSGWGRLIHILGRGWADEERRKLFRAVEEFSSINCLVRVLLQGGQNKSICKTVRLFYRRLFFEEDLLRRDFHDLAFWLSLILCAYSPENQALFLFVICGPTNNEGDLGNSVHTAIHTNRQSTIHAFGDLATALTALYRDSSCKCSMSSHGETLNVARLLDDVTNIPEPWLMDNLASLLLLCTEEQKGDELVYQFIKSRVTHNRIDEVAVIFESMFAVSYRIHMPYSSHVKLLKRIVGEMQMDCRIQLAHAFAHLHTEAVNEIVNNVVVGVAMNMDYHWEMGAHEKLMATVLEMAFGVENRAIDITAPEL